MYFLISRFRTSVGTASLGHEVHQSFTDADMEDEDSGEETPPLHLSMTPGSHLKAAKAPLARPSLARQPSPLSLLSLAALLQPPSVCVLPVLA
ncbi:hypothetical protein AMELA_G00004940 [Ameiurus melas]|uniref:Uncharacterized protein n=1 Tax=Ameiurus melas TaxID=219545 RepID=A0A7J6BF11_AMEME|nr:hypothetical protein AMELA_G00004940 [Ameiurus melas]